MTDEMRLEGVPAAPPPAKPPRPRRVPPVRLRSLVWLVVIGSVVVANHAFGTPYLRFEYSFTGSRERPVYHRCVYLGFDGFRVVTDGHCPPFRLFHGGVR
ncbi:hypothetical protein STVA_28040 [Allostella vacuolata]|nr:hypothetical protein STVA_28040 [Stella vacuolata]